MGFKRGFAIEWQFSSIWIQLFWLVNKYCVFLEVVEYLILLSIEEEDDNKNWNEASWLVMFLF